MLQEFKSRPAGNVKTTWQTVTYDVWGNASEGYEVNDVFRGEEVTLRIPQTKHNANTPREFTSAAPSDKQLRQIFGLGKSQIETEGDDLHIYVTRRRDGYPIGELFCTSHESLSPVCAKAEK